MDGGYISDYLLAVKGNQGSLAKAVKEALSAAMKKSPKMDVEKDHGRAQAREHDVLSAKDIAADFRAWTEL